MTVVVPVPPVPVPPPVLGAVVATGAVVGAAVVILGVTVGVVPLFVVVPFFPVAHPVKVRNVIQQIANITYNRFFMDSPPNIKIDFTRLVFH